MPPRTKLADQEPMAQTTVRFPRALLKRARIRAATDEVTLQALLIHALDRRTQAQREGRGSATCATFRSPCQRESIVPHTYT